MTAQALTRTVDGQLELTAAPPAGPLADDELAVEVRRVVLGPEDLHGQVGLAVGREAVGVVTAVGTAVDGWHPGDRVALPAGYGCGRCGACVAGRSTVCRQRTVPGRDRPGWAVPRALVPAHAAHHAPPELDDAHAALVPGVVATAYHALKRLGVGPDLEVAVLGEDATAAQAVQLAALAGARVVAVHPRASGREHALDLGADEAVDPAVEPTLEGVLAAADTAGVDRVLMTPTAPCTAAEALDLLRPGGKLVLVDGTATGPGGQLPVDALVSQDLDVAGSSGATGQDVQELFDLAAEGRLVLATTLSEAVTADQPASVLRALADPHVLRVPVGWR